MNEPLSVSAGSAPGSAERSPLTGGQSFMLPSSNSPSPGRITSVASRPLSQEEVSAVENAKLRLERMARLEDIVEKRKDSFAYLKGMHAGDSYWLNCVLLRRQTDLAIYATELPRQRILRLFYLGMSLARLAQGGGGAGLVKSILQLLEEWEYHFAGSATQSVRSMLAKGVDTPYPSSTISQEPAKPQEEPVVPKLFKFANDVVYEHLLTPQVPFSLDYFQVFFSLSDIICLVYNKFMDDECYGNLYIFDALMKVDAKIKQHVLNETADDFAGMSANIIKAELAQLR